MYITGSDLLGFSSTLFVYYLFQYFLLLTCLLVFKFINVFVVAGLD